MNGGIGKGVTEPGVPEYQELDEILDLVTRQFWNLRERYRQDLGQSVRIEQWRWDQPETVMSWIDGSKNHINKSIRFFVDQGESSRFRCPIEINAWRDEENKQVSIRYWRHETQTVIEINGLQDILDHNLKLTITGIDLAYHRVSGWGKEDLQRRAMLPRPVIES